MTGHGGTHLDVGQVYAVERMQAAYRGFKARKKVRLEAEARQHERGRFKAEAIMQHVKGLIMEVEASEARRKRGDGMGMGMGMEMGA
jgi:hypothetical protein